MLYYTETANSTQYSLDANTFFLFLLPPIIYDAGYHMPNKAFFNNLGTILLLAVVNTAWNTVGIGLGLWGMSSLGWITKDVSILHCFVFSALISAVDPVAVLAIFEEIQVNEILYIIVFGESLLNDGVTVVLYHMMEGFTEIGESKLQAVDFMMGFIQFFIVVFGGTLIGVVYGLIGAFITKYTDHVRVLEPLFIFVLGYLAYLTAESMELSGILALTFGGIVMRHYTESNMAKKSTTTVKYFMKMLANISETIIFMFLGLSVVIDTHEWHFDFILFTVLFCLIFRVTGVVFLSFIVNKRRLIRLSAIDQFIMSYGGLRGGIAFCLALLLNEHHIPERAMFVSTTMVMVFFTVFIQGITIKPVVNAFKVERAKEEEPSMNEMIHKKFIDHLMAGVEDVVGKSGHNSLQNRFEYYNNKYLKPWLLREEPASRNTSILRGFTKLNMQEAKAVVKSMTGMSRDPSYTQLINQSPYSARYNQSRRATIAVPSEADHETVVNMHVLDPSALKRLPEDETMQQMLGESMISPRSSIVRERRHTLADVHTEPQEGGEPLKNFLHDLHGSSLEAATNNLHRRANKQYLPSNGVKKKISFSGVHARLSKQLSDVAEIVQGNGEEETSQSPKVMFTVGKNSEDQDCNKPVTPTSQDQDSKQPMTASPTSDAPGTPSLANVPVNEPSNNTPNNTPTNTTQMPAADNNNTSPTTAFAISYNSSETCSPAQSTPPDKLESNSDHVHIPSSHESQTSSIPIVTVLQKKRHRSRKHSEQSNCSLQTTESDKVFSDSVEWENSPKEETIAESSLPWRRTSSNPPVPSSLSLSLPDDENPLMSEAPSWADNLAYHNLTETGSPYQSPQTTITAKPPEPEHTSVFDLFPPTSPSNEDNQDSVLPLPWSKNCQESHSGASAEPLPSHSSRGDKASQFLVSPHDLVPPAYHTLLQPQLHSINDGGSRQKTINAHSPIHFPLMEKIDSGNVETEIIGIEADYHHGMAERVSRWLAAASTNLEEEDPYQAGEEDRQKILESLRQKKDDTDEGTDADVESDCEVQDTHL